MQEDELLAKRGKLKIYLGAAPGVGKTYSMLTDGLAKHEQKIDVVVGLVEAHGRSEIDLLAKKLEILPRCKIEYHGHTLTEFDLDAALKRNPSIILIDEMAHTNASGMRHAKRWQDIKEILDRGIDVYTTLNVQHIESLNDVIAQIIHAHVKETVPDFMLERAEAIELIDLPTQELLKRLHEGKVYIPKQAEIASENFFREGNLNALRELALRVTAERVDAQLMRYRQGEGIHYIWPIKEKILVCIGGRAESAKLIRVAKRMATKLQADLIAVHVESPLMPLAEQASSGAINNLRLAEKLGAETYVLTGLDIVKEIINFAHEQNVTMIVVWKQIRSRWRDFLFRSLADELTRYSGEIDIHVITSEKDHMKPLANISLEPKSIKPPSSWWVYVIALGAVIFATLLNFALFPFVDLSVVIIMYLLSIMFVTIFGQMKPSFFASIVSVFACSFFFIYPYYNIIPGNYLANVTLGFMFLASLAICFYSIRFRTQVISARQSQHHTHILHRLSRQLASTRGEDKLLGIAIRYMSEIFDSDVLALCYEKNKLAIKVSYGSEPILSEKEFAVAQWVYDLGQIAGKGTDTLSFSDAVYVPLLVSHSTIGVLRIHPLAADRSFSPEQIHLMELCANQIAIALEVDRIEEHLKKSELQTEANHIRTTLLQLFSHDLRTPLIAVMGASTTLKELGHQLNQQEMQKISNTIYSELMQLNKLINNLLQMAYLEAEIIDLHLELQSLKHVIQVAVSTLTEKARIKNIHIEIPEDLERVMFDFKLMQEVFINLLDNAIKFTSEDSSVDINVNKTTENIVVCVGDHGLGIMVDEVDKLFEKFYRGRLLTTERGLGLGLAICFRIIRAHNGKIWAENRPDGGAVFCFTLPIKSKKQ